MTTTDRSSSGRYLNELWGVGVAHPLYIHDGHWYHQLRRFPAALFDRNGYVRFETEEEYRACPYLDIGKQISVPKRIASIPGYVRVAPGLSAVGAAALESTAFTVDNIDDARRRTAQAIVQRQGQLVFRSRLLRAYSSRCCISGFDAVQALEAAHIHPYRGPKTNHPTNGLLLRADLHLLFDQGLLGVDPTSMLVLLAPVLHRTSYSVHLGAKVSRPGRAADAPSKVALEWHRREHGL
jgi:hypothetical protein